MYLSKLLLDSRQMKVWRDLADCQAMHRRVMSAFPQAANSTRPREELGVLYRIEHNARRSEVVLLVQSSVSPDWCSLPTHYLSATSSNEKPTCKFIGAQYEALQPGITLRFRLRANPTRRISPRCEKEEKGQFGKRVEIYDEQQQLEWLERKAASGGFALLQIIRGDEPVGSRVQATPEAKFWGWRSAVNNEHEGEQIQTQRPRPARRKMTFGSVLFDGLLRVTDADLFRRTLRDGVGTGKSYGFGLLSIARYSTES